MGLGGSLLCGSGVLLHGTTSCCSSAFSCAFSRLVAARAVFRQLHPPLLPPHSQALQEGSPFTTSGMERSKHYCVPNLSLLHLYGNFPEAGKMGRHSAWEQLALSQLPYPSFSARGLGLGARILQTCGSAIAVEQGSLVSI